VEEGVHSEDGEHETEKDAGDENGDLHEQFSLRMNWAACGAPSKLHHHSGLVSVSVWKM
jgi:hypothetical protein